MKPTRPAVVAVFIGFHLALKAVFFSIPFYVHVARPVEVATRGLISPVMLAATIQTVLLVGVVMWWWGRLSAPALGLRLRDLGYGVLVTALLWIGVQATTLAFASVGGGALTPNPALRLNPAEAGRFLDAFLGSAGIEELMYRGFLMPQLFVLAGLIWRRAMPRALFAIVATQVYFGLNHIPAGLRGGLSTVEVGAFAVHAALVGGLFAALYLRTGNLFIAVGAHALINYPGALYLTGIDPALFTLIGSCVLLIGWPAFERVPEHAVALAARLRQAAAPLADALRQSLYPERAATRTPARREGFPAPHRATVTSYYDLIPHRPLTEPDLPHRAERGVDRLPAARGVRLAPTPAGD